MIKIIQFNCLLIICFFLICIVYSCAKKEETAENSEDSNDTSSSSAYTCNGSSTGGGPTIGSVNLEEATYLSTCFATKKNQLEFKNNSSGQVTFYEYSDNDSCANGGTPTSTGSFCIESISVSSTSVTKPKFENGSVGDNVTGYAVTGKLKHDSSTLYASVYAESSSVFWMEMSDSQSNLESNCCYIFKLTKQ